jgi:predicted DNA-binding transcriptional regulator YafY
MAQKATATSMRILHLLQALPPVGVESTTQLKLKLDRLGYKVTQRMVERDLRKLEAEGLAHAREGKPLGWARGQAALGLQLQDLNQALALDMMATFAGSLLPPSVAEQLRDVVAAARLRLGQHPNSDHARWRERIAVIPLSQPLIPPMVDADVQRAVLQAVLERRVLKLGYRARYSERVREHEVHPAGLVAREGQYILIGFLAGKKEPTQLVLHRMRSAQLLSAPAQIPPTFSLHEYARGAAMGMGNGEWVRLHLVFDEFAGSLFTESKLSTDQEVEVRTLKSGDKRYHVTATLEDSPRLQAYLNSFGSHLISRRQRSIPPPMPQDAAPSQPSTRKRTSA